MTSCIPEMLNPHSSFLIMTSCLWPSFPWYIYFWDLPRLPIFLCPNIDPLSFFLSSRPHVHPSSHPWCSLASPFVAPPLLNQTFNFVTTPVVVSWRKSLNGPCYQQGDSWSATSPQYQGHPESLLCFHSLCCPQGILQTPTRLLLSSGDSLRSKFQPCKRSPWILFFVLQTHFQAHFFLRLSCDWERCSHWRLTQNFYQPRFFTFDSYYPHSFCSIGASSVFEVVFCSCYLFFFTIHPCQKLLSYLEYMFCSYNFSEIALVLPTEKSKVQFIMKPHPRLVLQVS